MYITPDIYLTQQVWAEAQRLGIGTTEDPARSRLPPWSDDPRDKHLQLFNGRSVFGVQGAARDVTTRHSLLIDDTHACLATVEEQFTARLEAGHPAYSALLDLFGPSASRGQSATTYADLEQGDEFSPDGNSILGVG